MKEVAEGGEGGADQEQGERGGSMSGAPYGQGPAWGGSAGVCGRLSRWVAARLRADICPHT